MIRIPVSSRVTLEIAQVVLSYMARQRQKQLVKAAAKGRGKDSIKGAQELPITARFYPTCLGVTSEAFGDALAAFARDDPDRLFSTGTAAAKTVKVRACLATRQ